MFLAGIAPIGLFPHVKNFQRKDGQSADHRAGRFAVETGIRRGPAEFDVRQQRFVDAFDGIIALLVVFIDEPFASGDFCRFDIGASRLAFRVPQQGIEAVIAFNPGPCLISWMRHDVLGPVGFGKLPVMDSVIDMALISCCMFILSFF